MNLDAKYVRAIPLEKALVGNFIWIDVRTPAEFKEAHIPEAYNVPLLSNEERIEVGIVYKELGEKAARMLGFKRVIPRLIPMVDDIVRYAQGKEIVLYCWRGGMRSQSVNAILSMVGIAAYHIQGGYKAYRRYSLQQLQNSYPFSFIVLYGYTGCGKTDLIRQLAMKQIPIIDLEQLASHRGSVFGNLGLEEQPSQKQFDGKLEHEFRRLRGNSLIFVEGESRKIGRISLPLQFMETMAQGIKVHLSCSLETRVLRVLQEYRQAVINKREEAMTSLFHIRSHLGNQLYDRLNSHLTEHNYEAFTDLLLRNYYDKKYKDSRVDSFNYALSVDTEDLEKAVATLESFYNDTIRGQVVPELRLTE